jgi:outer membrane biosynthesis protein TonB
MRDNPVVMAVFLVLGGLVGIWGFFRFPLPALLVNYPTKIVSKALKFIPALALLLGGQTAIQAEPVTRLDDHLTSQAESPESVQEAANTMEAVFVSAAPVQVFGSDTVGIGLMDKGWVQFVAGESQPTPLPLQAATQPEQPNPQPTQPNPQPTQPNPQPEQPGVPTKPKKPPTKGVDDNGFVDVRV